MAAPRVKMTVSGADELKRRITGLSQAFLKEMEQAIPEEAKGLMAAANALAPRVSGKLIESSVVTSEVKSNKVLAAASYTDEKAAAVHEGVHWGLSRVKDPRYHLDHLKWYERALNAFAPGFSERMVTRLRKLVGG